MLVQNDANINILNKRGQSPLHLAAQNGDDENLAFLIQNQANLNIMDSFGKYDILISNKIILL